MSDNTPEFHVPVEQVIAGAVRAKLKRVLIIGETENGKFYAAGSEHTEEHLADIESFRSGSKAMGGTIPRRKRRHERGLPSCDLTWVDSAMLFKRGGICLTFATRLQTRLAPRWRPSAGCCAVTGTLRSSPNRWARSTMKRMCRQPGDDYPRCSVLSVRHLEEGKLATKLGKGFILKNGKVEKVPVVHNASQRAKLRKPRSD